MNIGNMGVYIKGMEGSKGESGREVDNKIVGDGVKEGKLEG